MSDLGLDMNKLTNFSDLGLPGTFGDMNEVVNHEPLKLVPVKSNPEDRTQDLISDYETVRQNIHYQNQMLMNVAEIFLEIAKNSESPNFLQAFSGLMNQMNNTNKELLNIHKDMKKICEDSSSKKKKEESQNSSPINIQQATVFMGSTSDLMDEIEFQNESKIIEGEVL